MRVLTRREREAFEAAWIFMERVGGMYESNGEEARTVDRVMVRRKDSSVESLPPKVKAVVWRMGGLRAVNAFFNGLRKERNFKIFVDSIMRCKGQPRDYWADGTLFYDRYGQHGPKAVEVVYEERR